MQNLIQVKNKGLSRVDLTFNQLEKWSTMKYELNEDDTILKGLLLYELKRVFVKKGLKIEGLDNNNNVYHMAKAIINILNENNEYDFVLMNYIYVNIYPHILNKQSEIIEMEHDWLIIKGVKLCYYRDNCSLLGGLVYLFPGNLISVPIDNSESFNKIADFVFYDENLIDDGLIAKVDSVGDAYPHVLLSNNNIYYNYAVHTNLTSTKKRICMKLNKLVVWGVFYKGVYYEMAPPGMVVTRETEEHIVCQSESNQLIFRKDLHIHCPLCAEGGSNQDHPDPNTKEGTKLIDSNPLMRARVMITLAHVQKLESFNKMKQKMKDRIALRLAIMNSNPSIHEDPDAEMFHDTLRAIFDISRNTLFGNAPRKYEYLYDVCGTCNDGDFCARVATAHQAMLRDNLRYYLLAEDVVKAYITAESLDDDEKIEACELGPYMGAYGNVHSALSSWLSTFDDDGFGHEEMILVRRSQGVTIRSNAMIPRYKKKEGDATFLVCLNLKKRFLKPFGRYQLKIRSILGLKNLLGLINGLCSAYRRFIITLERLKPIIKYCKFFIVWYTVRILSQGRFRDRYMDRIKALTSKIHIARIVTVDTIGKKSIVVRSKFPGLINFDLVKVARLAVITCCPMFKAEMVDKTFFTVSKAGSNYTRGNVILKNVKREMFKLTAKYVFRKRKMKPLHETTKTALTHCNCRAAAGDFYRTAAVDLKQLPGIELTHHNCRAVSGVFYRTAKGSSGRNLLSFIKLTQCIAVLHLGAFTAQQLDFSYIECLVDNGVALLDNDDRDKTLMSEMDVVAARVADRSGYHEISEPLGSY